MERQYAALGSIPACTGEPSLEGRRCCPLMVYPRVYGGTAEVIGAHNCLMVGVYPRVYGGTASSECPATLPPFGLSPRVRGNRTLPAGGMDSLFAGLSPRVRGNHVKSVLGGAIWSRSGLSPRVRGTTSKAPGPVSLASRSVYPRVYGGTSPIDQVSLPDNGLSARVRGNRRAPP